MVDVAGELLSVRVVREQGDSVVIELPRTAIAGQRVRVPRESLVEEVAPGRRGCAVGVLVALAVAVGVGAWPSYALGGMP